MARHVPGHWAVVRALDTAWASSTQARGHGEATAGESIAVAGAASPRSSDHPILKAATVAHVCDMPTSSSNVRSQEYTGRHLLRLSSSDFVKMLWGERRGRGTMGAVQRLPMELTHVATFSF
jgi:hypothetical protein